MCCVHISDISLYFYDANLEYHSSACNCTLAREGGKERNGTQQIEPEATASQFDFVVDCVEIVWQPLTYFSTALFKSVRLTSIIWVQGRSATLNANLNR